ncbi:MAG: YicC family protein [Cryomorphaceae bacterium]|nr:YicC family protein [Cryomorphaceae bacterium]
MDQVALQSMTGFGKANGQFQDKKISVEVRSLNSKGLDLNLKIPSSYRDLETPVRKLVTDALMRGKMDLGIYIESQQHQVSGLINESVATAYFEKLKALNDTWGTNTQDYLSIVLRMPDVLNSQLEALSDQEAQFVLDLVQEACAQLQKFRKQEGQGLAQDLKSNLAHIQNELQAIVPFEQERVAQVKERIQKGLASIDESRIDANRLEQEMIYYVEKLDISEEKQRLQQHLNYFTETLNQEASGKKLGFIAQEMGREINTLGSKCNHSEIQRRVVIMKDHLEKIKEQVLNAL